jgi:hypothetical protein
VLFQLILTNVDFANPLTNFGQSKKKSSFTSRPIADNEDTLLGNIILFVHEILTWRQTLRTAISSVGHLKSGVKSSCLAVVTERDTLKLVQWSSTSWPPNSRKCVI